MKKQKILLVLLTAALALQMPATVLAADVTTSGGKGTTQAIADVAATNFRVTVPTSLPVSVSSSGEVQTANDVKIINHSFGPVCITGVTITGTNGWTLADYNGGRSSAFASIPMDSNRVGLTISANGKAISTDGIGNAQSFVDSLGAWTLAGTTELPISYDAIVSPVTTAKTAVSTADVAFTVGWVSAPKPLTGVTLDFVQLNMEKGTPKKLTAAPVPADTSDTVAFTWSSSNPAVATVDQEGNLTPVEWGTTTVTVSAGGQSATCDVTVLKVLAGLEMNVSSISIIGGSKTYQLTVSSKYRSAVIWSSSNEAIAQVDQNGLVTSRSYGKADIVATMGGQSATCAVSVLFPDSEKFRVNIDKPEFLEPYSTKIKMRITARDNAVPKSIEVVFGETGASEWETLNPDWTTTGDQITAEVILPDLLGSTEYSIECRVDAGLATSDDCILSFLAPNPSYTNPSYFTFSDGTITGFSGKYMALGKRAPASIAFPSVIDGKPVTAIGAEAFSGSSSLSDVSIPEGVTTINLGAFRNCSNLSMVFIPPSATKIFEVFSGCTNLDKIYIFQQKPVPGTETPDFNPPWGAPRGAWAIYWNGEEPEEPAPPVKTQLWYSNSQF